MTKNIAAQIIMKLMLINMVLNRENEGWINFIDPYGWFQWFFRYWLGRRSLDDKRQIARWKGIVSRVRGKLIKMIKDVNGRFDNYSISSICIGAMN